MGLFSKKKEKEDDKKANLPKLPELPSIPKLPKISEMDEDEEKYNLPKLPSFPNNSYGEKFSQDTIKEAVGGVKEEEEVDEADEFDDDEERMMQKPLRKSNTKEIYDTSKTRNKRVPEEFREAAMRVREAEPIFVRLDKFEESLKLFEKTKDQITEIEKMLSHIRKIKEDEEKEIEFWENEMQMIKKNIDKIDREVFSKI